MWPFTRRAAGSTLDQEFITRYWDLAGKVDNLEAHVDERLDELGRRYKRAEQAERRLDEKRTQEVPCVDEALENGPSSLYDLARRARVSARAARDTP